MNTKIVRARDVMRSSFIELDGMVTVKEAIEQLRKTGTTVVMVKKRYDDDAHGMVLLTDFSTQVLAMNRAPDRVNLYEIMVKPIVSVPPSMDVRYCARLFDRLGLSVAPVIEDEKVLGVVSYGELVLRGLFALCDQ